MRGVFQTAAVERHQPLITAHIGALIDGHREMALAEQRAGILAGLEPRGVVARIGAQAIRRLEIHDQKRHRAVSPGLQDEATIEFQRRAEQRREHDGFPKQLAHGSGIIVLGQDVVERGAKPGQPAAQIERADLERQRRIVDRHGRRRADRRLGGNPDAGKLRSHGALSGVGGGKTKER